MAAGQLRLGAGTPPPVSPGEGTLYFDSGDDQLYVIDSAGNTVGPITGGGGTNATSLQGYDVGITPPTNGQVLTWDNLASEWLPAAPTGGAPSGAAGGDLGGNYPNPSVAALQGNAVSAVGPNHYNVLTWNISTSQWEPTNRDVGPANAVYMSTTGSDTTGRHGDPSRPFLTLQGALGACFSGDTIFVGPGIFEVNQVPGTPFTWPATLTSVSVVGCGVVTSFVSVTPNPTAGTLLQDGVITGVGSSLLNLAWSAPSLVPLEGFRLENLSLSAPGAESVIRVSDTNSPIQNYMMGDGLVLRNVSLYNPGIANLWALNASNVNNYTFDNVDLTGADVRLYNCREKRPTRDLRARNLGLRIDSTDGGLPLMWSGGAQTFEHSTFGNNVYLGGQANVLFGKTCVIDGTLTSSGTVSVSGPLAVGGIYVPHLRFFGRVGNVTLTGAASIPNTATTMVLDFSGAEILNDIGNTLTMGTIAFECAGPDRQRVKADGVVAGQVGVIDAIDYFDRFLDISQSQVVTTGSGTVAPRVWTRAVTLGLTGTDTIKFRNPATATDVKTYAAPQVAHITGSSVVQGVLAIQSLAADEVKVASTAPSGAGTAYVTAFWTATY